MPFLHSKCEFHWAIERWNNARRLVLKDKSCNFRGGVSVLSKEKLKNLFEKQRVSNLLYLEGLEILQSLRKLKIK